MKKVLFISHDALRTGAPLYLIHLIKWLQRNSDVSAEVLLRMGGPLVKDFQEIAPTRWITGGVITDSTRLKLVGRVRRKLGIRSLTGQLRAFYPAEEFPLVYSNTITNGELIREFAPAGQKIICHVHEMRMGMERWGGSSLPEATKLTDLFIATSSAVKRDLREILDVPAEKIELVNGFGQPRALAESQYRETREKIRRDFGLKENTIAIGMCGTIDWRKGADLFPSLVRAVKRQQSSPEDYRFFWIGAQESLEYVQLKHDLKKLGLEEMVSLVGSVPNPQDYFAALDIFALLSREDPFPLVMLEAAALGLPMVCFEGSGGAEELIADEAGIGVPYLDVDLFAQAIVKLGGDRELRQTLGRRAQGKTLSQFTLETQGPKLLALIKRYLP